MYADIRLQDTSSGKRRKREFSAVKHPFLCLSGDGIVEQSKTPIIQQRENAVPGSNSQNAHYSLNCTLTFVPAL